MRQENLEKYISNLQCFKPYKDASTIFQIQNKYEHTMFDKLDSYICNKIHSDSNSHLIPKFVPYYLHEKNRCIISTKEKTNKLFNYQRPTLDIKDSLCHYIFPGNDYLLHYTLLYNYHLNTNKTLECLQDLNHIQQQEVPFHLIWNTLKIPTNISPTVILGYVESIKENNEEWTDWIFNDQFGYTYHKNKKVMLLGCKHSYWGDIAGVLTYKLASYGVRNILYVGKLGTLNEGLHPNETIVSGSHSYLCGDIVNWTSSDLCSRLKINKVKHYSLPSTMLETKAWAIKARTEFDVVDPEIGHMALQSLQCGINFGYLHLVTDFLLDEKQEEGLHNENNFKEKRERTLNQLKQLIFNLPIW